MDDVTVPGPKDPVDDVTTSDSESQEPMFDVASISDPNREGPMDCVTISDPDHTKSKDDVTIPKPDVKQIVEDSSDNSKQLLVYEERISYSFDGSSIGEDDDLELPGLGVENAAAIAEMQNFRQRSPASDGLGRKLKAFDVENGLHPSQSMLKLEELELAAQSSVSAVSVLKTLFFVLVWYTFSTCLTLYNKTLLGDHLGKFPAPLLMNTFHFTLQAVLSKIIVCIQSHGSNPKVSMSWNDYFVRVVPTALGTALDINLSNASLVFISVTFATMCKSASPIFLLLFAFAFRLESPSIKLLGIILIISFGVLLTGTTIT